MARTSLHTNLVKWYNRHVADRVKQFRRQVRRAMLNPRLAWEFHRFNAAISRRDWRDAHRRLFGIASRAERAGDARLLLEMSFAAERLGEHEKSTEWAVAHARMTEKAEVTAWRGEDLNGATLVIRFIENEKQPKASGLGMAGYVAAAAATAARCVLILEERLVPLFARTLPRVEVLPFPSEPDLTDSGRIVTANPLILKSVLDLHLGKMNECFLPLKADSAVSEEMRKRYLGGRRLPVVGISWWSSHFGKDLPDIHQWARLLTTTEAVFVSLQYGDVQSDLAVLEKAAPGRMLVDASVDQMVDMDRFAAQIGALDAVVTISNTGAHLAGAMGVPTILIRDDWFRRMWPVLSDRTPKAPHTLVVGKEGRSWDQVMTDVQEKLAEVVRLREGT